MLGSLRERVLVLPDGRRVSVLVVGEGKPIVYFHATASSRLEALLLADFACTFGFQLVCADRPGYGLSTPTRRRSICDFAGDMEFLAGALGLGRFGVLGWSGGGVFALAYAALFPHRITRVVVAGTPALPFDAASAHGSPFARFAMKLPFVGMLALWSMRTQVLKVNAKAFSASRDAERLFSSFSEADMHFLSDKTRAALLCKAMAEAFRQRRGSVSAVLSEHALFMKPWSLPFAKLPAGKVVVCHGAEDKTCPVENAFKLADAIPGARVEVLVGGGHFALFENPELLADLFLFRC